MNMHIVAKYFIILVLGCITFQKYFCIWDYITNVMKNDKEETQESNNGTNIKDKLILADTVEGNKINDDNK